MHDEVIKMPERNNVYKISMSASSYHVDGGTISCVKEPDQSRVGIYTWLTFSTRTPGFIYNWIIVIYKISSTTSRKKILQGLLRYINKIHLATIGKGN